MTLNVAGIKAGLDAYNQTGEWAPAPAEEPVDKTKKRAAPPPKIPPSKHVAAVTADTTQDLVDQGIPKAQAREMTADLQSRAVEQEQAYWDAAAKEAETARLRKLGAAKRAAVIGERAGLTYGEGVSGAVREAKLKVAKEELHKWKEGPGKGARPTFPDPGVPFGRSMTLPQLRKQQELKRLQQVIKELEDPEQPLPDESELERLERLTQLDKIGEIATLRTGRREGKEQRPLATTSDYFPHGLGALPSPSAPGVSGVGEHLAPTRRIGLYEEGEEGERSLLPGGQDLWSRDVERVLGRLAAIDQVIAKTRVEKERWRKIDPSLLETERVPGMVITDRPRPTITPSEKEIQRLSRQQEALTDLRGRLSTIVTDTLYAQDYLGIPNPKVDYKVTGAAGADKAAMQTAWQQHRRQQNQQLDKRIGEAAPSDKDIAKIESYLKNRGL